MSELAPQLVPIEMRFGSVALKEHEDKFMSLLYAGPLFLSYRNREGISKTFDAGDYSIYRIEWCDHSQMEKFSRLYVTAQRLAERGLIEITHLGLRHFSVTTLVPKAE